MDTSAPLTYLLVGGALLLAGVLPPLVSRRAVSEPMGFVGAGVLVGLLPLPLPRVDPVRDHALALHLTEVCVIVSLMGVGLALDRRPSWRGWASTWRLLLLAMPACIAAVALLGWWVMGLAPAGALLLGAALAPTDPVLAGEVQVGAPSTAEEGEDEVRFSLTSEAGLNDGLAFPFVHAAVLLAGAASVGTWAPGWLAWDVLGRVVVGVAVGWLLGWAVSRASFQARVSALRFAETGDAVIALAATFLAYGLTEVVHGYGFVAVFAAALSIRDHERGHDYHRQLHRFIGEVERLLTLGLLLLLGLAVSDGLLGALTWRGAAVGVLLVLLVRPACAWASMARGRAGARERHALAFFGVRGIGSFFYLAWATREAGFARVPELWSTVAFTVLVSVVVHGVSATPVMRRLDRMRDAVHRPVRPLRAPVADGREPVDARPPA